MTPEQLEQWADMCTPNTETGSLNYLKFAKLIESATREECAKVCDASSHRDDDMGAILAKKIRSET